MHVAWMKTPTELGKKLSPLIRSTTPIRFYTGNTCNLSGGC